MNIETGSYAIQCVDKKNDSFEFCFVFVSGVSEMRFTYLNICSIGISI